MIDLGDWKEPLAPLFADERYKKIRAFLIEEYRHHIVYPDMYDIYNCFRYTPFANVKAVLLGQDPYHNEGQAHGLCFSVQDGVPKPPSLENMFKELQDDLGYPPRRRACCSSTRRSPCGRIRRTRTRAAAGAGSPTRSSPF